MRKNDYVAHEQIGYYCRDVKMVNMARLDDHEYAQCGFKVENGALNYYSYSSLLFSLPLCKFKKYNSIYTEVELCFCIAPDYSRTTIKHVNWFCRQLNTSCDYYSIKKAYYDDDLAITITCKTDNLKEILELY